MTTKTIGTICAALFFILISGSFSTTDAASAACDRECLKGFMTKYLDALTGKIPDALPLDTNVRFTENCKESKVGEGFWKDVNGTVTYRLDIIDINQSGVGALVVIKGGASALLAVRLKISNQKISEIETMVTKSQSEGMIFVPDGFKGPPADSMMTVMPKPELLNTRAEMIEIASKYPEAMKQKKANFNANGLYFTEGTFRLENGQIMAGPGCVMGSGCKNIGTQGLPQLPGMVYKPALVDEQAGIVFLRMNFGEGSLGKDAPGTLDVFEAFKVYNDSMHAVYAVMHVVPKGTGFGWEYDATPITNPSSATVFHNPGNVTVTTNGILIPTGFFSDKISLEMYDISGRLVYTKDIEQFKRSNTIFMPLTNMSSGHYIGQVQYCTGRNITSTSLFNMNIAK